MKPAFLFINYSGDFEGIQMRVEKEGYKCYGFYSKELIKGGCNTGKGLINLVDSLDEIILDYMETPDDLIIIFDDNMEPQRAELYKKMGYKVIGCSAYSEKMEHERQKGNELAKNIGLELPKSHTFTDINQGIGFAKSKEDTNFVFKPDGADLAGSAKTYPSKSNEDLTRFMNWLLTDMQDHNYKIDKFELQEIVKGVEVDFAGWWNGQSFPKTLGVTFEQKKLDGLGAAVGCMGQVFTYVPAPEPFKSYFYGLEMLLKDIDKETGFSPNEWAMNTIVSEETKKPNFLEWTPRFGWDSTFGEFSLMQEAGISIAKFLIALANGEKLEKFLPIGRYSAAVRLFSESVGSPNEKVKGKPLWVDKRIEDNVWFYGVEKNKDHLQITGNIFAVVTAVGDTPQEALAKLYYLVDPKNGLISSPDMFYSEYIGNNVLDSLNRLSELKIMGVY